MDNIVTKHRTGYLYRRGSSGVYYLEYMMGSRSYASLHRPAVNFVLLEKCLKILDSLYPEETRGREVSAVEALLHCTATQ